MSQHVFHFKQFSIAQDQCAMKVSLDACLFGACCDVRHAKTILDIGSGTGLLALMLAQKKAAHVDAIEIDASAAQQAQENVKASPFKSRIHVHQTSVQTFTSTTQPEQYDVIICNPPFFSDHLNSDDAQRNLARHNDSLSFNELTTCMNQLLNNSGKAWLLLPQQEHLNFLKASEATALNLTKRIDIFSRKNKPSKLAIWIYSKESYCEVKTESITIYDENTNQYSEEFSTLLADYYLKL